jgi:hypothetical protein
VTFLPLMCPSDRRYLSSEIHLRLSASICGQMQSRKSSAKDYYPLKREQPQMNTDKHRWKNRGFNDDAGFLICVYPCSSVADKRQPQVHSSAA